jgi:MFS family permease
MALRRNAIIMSADKIQESKGSGETTLVESVEVNEGRVEEKAWKRFFHKEFSCEEPILEEAVCDVTLDKIKLVNRALGSLTPLKRTLILFFCVGAGWFLENSFPTLIMETVPYAAKEFNVKSYFIPSLIYTIGSALGTFASGLVADCWGRRKVFRVSLGILCICLLLMAFSVNLAMYSVFAGVLGLLAGPTIPVDGALFAECLMPTRQWLLRLLVSMRPLGRFFTLLVERSFEPLTCSGEDVCIMKKNIGWRLTNLGPFVVALVGFVGRLYYHRYLESPKYLAVVDDNERVMSSVRHLSGVSRNIGDINGLSVSALDDVDVDNIERVQNRERGIMCFFKEFTFHFKRNLGYKRQGLLIYLFWLALGVAYSVDISCLMTILGQFEAQSEAELSRWTHLLFPFSEFLGSCLVTGLSLYPDLGVFHTIFLKVTCVVSVVLFSIGHVSHNLYTAALCVFFFSTYGLFTGFFPHTIEFFPTVYRATAVGLCVSSFKLGTILPMLIDLQSLKHSHLLVISWISTMVLVSTAAWSLFFPINTVGRPNI